MATFESVWLGLNLNEEFYILTQSWNGKILVIVVCVDISSFYAPCASSKTNGTPCPRLVQLVARSCIESNFSSLFSREKRDLSLTELYASSEKQD